MNKIPTNALVDIIEQLDARLAQMRRFANNGPDDHNGVSLERLEVFRKLERDIEVCDKDLIELEQILALVIEYNEAHKDE